MRKRKVSVFVYLNLERIEKMRNEGWTLHTIYQDLQAEFGEQFSFNTFATSFQRAKKKFNEVNAIEEENKNKTAKIVNIKPAKQQHPKGEKVDVLNTFNTARAIKNSDPWEN